MRVAVVGGGISGLSAAYFLCRGGVDCTLIEENPRLGGVIRTDTVDGCTVEAGPDSFISQKPWALELIRELGMEDQVIGSNDHLRRTFVVKRGRLTQLPDGLQLLAPTKVWPIVTSALFGPATKLKMGLEWFRRPRRAGRERTVAEFVEDHYGREAVEYLAQPLLAGVYGGEPEELSVDAVLPRFVELEEKYGSVSRGAIATRNPAGGASKGSLFLSLRGGMQSLTDRLVEELESGRLGGGWKRICSRAVGLRAAGGGWEVAIEAEAVQADRVILAMPAYRAAELLREVDEAAAGLLRRIRYSSSVVAAMIYHRPEFDHPLDGFGFLVPRAENRGLAACTWVNTKFDGRAGEERALLRGFLGGEKAEKAAGVSDAEVAAAMHAELSDLMGFEAAPARFSVARWDRAMALYGVGHTALVEEIEGRLRRYSGLALAGNAYGGIGIPDCVRRGREVAEGMIGR